MEGAVFGVYTLIQRKPCPEPLVLNAYGQSQTISELIQCSSVHYV